MKKLFLLIIFFGIIQSSFSQQQEAEETSGDFQYGVGVAGQLLRLKKGQFPDPLVRFNKVEFIADLLNISVHVNETWSVSGFVQTRYRASGSSFSDKFRSALNERFSGEYYVPYRSRFPHKEASASRYLSYFFGVNKAFKVNKIILRPGLYFGTRAIELSFYTQDFKEKNSNRLVEYTIVSNHFDETEPSLLRTFEVSPSVKVIYPLDSYLKLFTELRVTYFQTDLYFDESIIDLYTGERTDKRYRYDKHNSNYIIVAGILIQP